ncbi:MAG: hypothetical protein IKZ61_11145 [Prevotella sp.]|nr:hypothetical protein [Prevotella sp.]
MKRGLLLFIVILSFMSSAKAQQASSLQKEITTLNEIIKKNTKLTDGLQVSFSLDENNHILNLFLNRNKPFPASKEETLQMFTIMPELIPVAIITSAYGISKNQLGNILLLKYLVDGNYSIKVTVSDSNKESINYEFPATQLTAMHN